jgi:hypothetical protein
MKRTGGILTTAAIMAAITACSSMESAPETAPTTPAAEAPTQEPTTEAPTEAPPVEEPTTHDGVDLAANYPDADTQGFTTQYRAITHDADTPDGEVATGGYQLCYDMDIQGPQAIIDQGAQALMQAGAPTQQDALNISSLLAYAAAKHVCPWNEQYVLEIIQTQ